MSTTSRRSRTLRHVSKRNLASPKGRRGVRLFLETLEARIAPAASPLVYDARDATPLLLRASQDAIQIVNLDAPTQVLASQPRAAIAGGVWVEGEGAGVTFAIDSSVPQLPGGIHFVGGSGTNTLIGPAVDTTWHITAPGAGDLDGPGFVQFSGVTNVRGGATGSA